MNCLEKYRAKLIGEINRDLRVIVEIPDEDAVHDFRVGIKRLTALYCFLNQIDPALRYRRLLKPYRLLFKSIGKIRDLQIAIDLIQGLNELDLHASNTLVKALRADIRRDFRQFQDYARTHRPVSIRMPSVRATGISERSILRNKPLVLKTLLMEILDTAEKLNASQWHKKRILLKRYHHELDAFRFCPGHLSDETELKQIKVLEQLLGDWHDRVVTAALLRSLQTPGAEIETAVGIMNKQDRLLLGSAKIYLAKFANWHRLR